MRVAIPSNAGREKGNRTRKHGAAQGCAAQRDSRELIGFDFVAVGRGGEFFYDLRLSVLRRAKMRVAEWGALALTGADKL